MREQEQAALAEESAIRRNRNGSQDRRGEPPSSILKNGNIKPPKKDSKFGVNMIDKDDEEIR